MNDDEDGVDKINTEKKVGANYWKSFTGGGGILHKGYEKGTEINILHRETCSSFIRYEKIFKRKNSIKTVG